MKLISPCNTPGRLALHGLELSVVKKKLVTCSSDVYCLERTETHVVYFERSWLIATFVRDIVARTNREEVIDFRYLRFRIKDYMKVLTMQTTGTQRVSSM